MEERIGNCSGINGTVPGTGEENMFGRKTLDRIERMLDEAIAGNFRESDYDESQMSRVESKWKHYLGLSALTRENMEREKENIKSLVSDISHQTKTPMTNIQLYTALLREKLEAGEDCGEKRQNLRLLNEISAQAEKLDFLIRSLTKMSRLESNIVEVKPCRQKVAELLEAVIWDAEVKAEQKGIEIVNTYSKDGYADYDMKWTKEALGNVLDNAVKYSRPGGRIYISVTEYELYTAVTVKDKGIGIKEEDTAKIFGRFYRAEEVQQEDGVGIGLYLAREILKKENGYIKVRSKPGEGAEFVLFLQKTNPFRPVRFQKDSGKAP